jgi:hypothetical protein
MRPGATCTEHQAINPKKSLNKGIREPKQQSWPTIAQKKV